MKQKGCERNWSLPTQGELFWHLPGLITENHNMLSTVTHVSSIISKHQ